MQPTEQRPVPLGHADRDEEVDTSPSTTERGPRPSPRPVHHEAIADADAPRAEAGLAASAAALSERVSAMLAGLRRHDSAHWREAVRVGVAHLPEIWLRNAPPFFGLVLGLSLHQRRAAVLRSLRLARGERGPARELYDAMRVFGGFASCLTEAFYERPDRPYRARFVGDHHYRAAHARGRGVIVVTAHTGGWQAGASILREAHGHEVLVVMQRERDRRAEEVQDAMRGRAGTRVVRIGESPLDALPVLGHLRRGGVVAMQIDRLPPGMRGRQVRLFDEPYEIPEGPLSLAMVSGAPVVPCFTRRLGFMEYEMNSHAPVWLARRASPDEVQAAAQRIADDMGAYLSAHALEWYNFE